MSGVSNFLHGLEVIQVDGADKPISVPRVSVFGIVCTSGKLPVNKPVLVAGSYGDAVRAVGTFRNDGFTGPAAMKALMIGTSTVAVVINVCDPNNHWSEVTDEVAAFNGRGVLQLTRPFVREIAINQVVHAPVILRGTAAVTLPAGVTVQFVSASLGGQSFQSSDYVLGANSTSIARSANSAILSGQTVYVAYTVAGGVLIDRDYTVDSANGRLLRTTSGGKILPGASLAVDFVYTDPSKVTEEDILGGVDAAGVHSGVQALLTGATETGYKPKVLLAPGYTHQKDTLADGNRVTTALLAVADRLKAIVLKDITDPVDAATAIMEAADFGHDRLMTCYPYAQIPRDDGSAALVPGSAILAGHIAQVDSERGWWHSPSNLPLPGVERVSVPVPHTQGDKASASNLLSEKFVWTIVRNSNEFRSWGNRTASGDFVSVTRTRDAIGEAIIVSLDHAVDRNIRKALPEYVVERVNEFLRRLQAGEVILGGECWFDRAKNPDAQLRDGHLVFSAHFTAMYPAERITFELATTDRYFANIWD